MANDEKRTKLAKRLYPNLATWEILLWTAGWIFGVGYSIYHVYLASKRYWRYLSVHDFEPGFFAASRKDVSDNEWTIFSENLVRSTPWLILHFIGTQCFQRSQQNMIPIFHASLPLLYLTRILEIRPVILLLAQPLAVFIVAEITQLSIAVWGIAVGIIVMNDAYGIGDFKAWAFEDSTWFIKYLTHVTMFWVNSRCVSFCLDHIWKEVPVEAGESRFWKFVKMVAFCFYIPNGIGGPLINYKDYYEGIYGTPKAWTISRIKELALLFVRYMFWYACVELWLHFLYVSALRHETKLLSLMDLWTLAGIGYSIGQFFMMKYVFFYGITRPFMKADGIDPPDHPKCIGRIHLYSDMWRYFDAGLHKFMHRYIYMPVMGKKSGVLNQLFAATVCFSFIYVWHGIMPNVLKWSVLNYIGIVTETAGRTLWKNEMYQKMEKSLLGPRGRRRLHAVAAAPLYLLSIISNMYFLIGLEAGDIFLKRGFNSWPWGTPLTLFFMYCGSQVSIEMKNWEIWKELAKLSDEHTN